MRDSPQSTSLPGWSDPIYRVDPSPSSTGASDSFGRWIRTAHLSGSMTSNCVPTFHTPTLNVSYVLQVRWPLHGLANGVKEVVATWVGHSGIGRDAQASAQAGHALPALPAYENERANGTGPVGAGEARKEKGEAGRGDPFPSPFRSP